MSAFTLPGLSEHDALEALTIADADRFRIVVTPDPEADGPFQWGQVGIVPLHSHSISNSTPEEGSDPLDLARALSRMSGDDYPFGGVTIPARLPSSAATDRVVAAVIRWAAVFHGTAVARWATSLDQSTYVDGLVYLEDSGERVLPLDEQRDSVSAYLETLTQWGRGDVVSVSLQRDATQGADAMLGDGPEWVEVGDLGSIGGCYLETGEDGYTAADAVAEHWGVPIDFAHAVAVVDGEGY